MDVSDDSYYILNEKGNKGSQMGHTKKIFFLNVSLTFSRDKVSNNNRWAVF